MKKIAHGAEAVVWESEGKVIKHRLPKAYRLPELDVLMRRQRTRREARILRKLSAVLRVPRVLEEKEGTLVLEKIEGKPLKECISIERCEQAGEMIGKIHAVGVVHGDLTTSNFIFGKGLTLIDFGLAYTSFKPEDFAADVHVFEEIVPQKCFEAFWKGYVKAGPKASEVSVRLEKLKKRGRYRKED